MQSVWWEIQVWDEGDWRWRVWGDYRIEEEALRELGDNVDKGAWLRGTEVRVVKITSTPQLIQKVNI